METSYIYTNFWRQKLVEINLLFERGSTFQILFTMKAFFGSILFCLIGVIWTIIKLFSINAEFSQNKQLAMPKILEIYLTLLLTTCTKAWWCSVPKQCRMAWHFYFYLNYKNFRKFLFFLLVWKNGNNNNNNKIKIQEDAKMVKVLWYVPFVLMVLTSYI